MQTMSKASSSTGFRNVNVDEFDEDNYVEDSIEQAQDYAGDVAARASNVVRLLNSKNYEEALKTALKNPPILCKDLSIKVCLFVCLCLDKERGERGGGRAFPVFIFF